MCIQAEKSVDIKITGLVYLAFISILIFFCLIFYRVYLVKINLCLAQVTCVPVMDIVSRSDTDVV